ncbi:MAG: EamA family transporter, partial [Deltaproteobacteria bacterium]|nr:EamA family transporter [Deltaproteobacteria bacterium]
MPYLLLTLTVLFWSGNFILGRGVHDVIPPIAMSFWRWTIALLIILPF